MHRRPLGAAGPALSALGLGCMGMSDFYTGATRTDALATIDAALRAGVGWLDTGDFYGSGHNELLIAEALAGRPRGEVFLAVKAGVLRDPAGAFLGLDCRPQALKNFLAMTLRRLGTDHVDLYQPARLDPAVPVEETVGAIKEMIDRGWVRHLGLSEVGAESLRRAHAVHPVAWLQIEYSLLSRGIEAAILPACRELGVAVCAYGVLSRGLLSGHWTAGRGSHPADFRAHLPRFAPGNVERNLALVEALAAIARDQGRTVAQLAIAWVLAQGPELLALVGARRPAQLDEALGALDLGLDANELARIEAAVPADAVAGTRYDTEHMARLDSERS